jgi:hypothetical protein
MKPEEKSKLYNCVEEIVRYGDNPGYLTDWLEKLYDRVEALEARFTALHGVAHLPDNDSIGVE